MSGLGARTNALVNALRPRAGETLRTIADRLDPDHAPRWSGYTWVRDPYGWEPRFYEGYRPDGCRLWYLGHAERDKVFPPAEIPSCELGGWPRCAKGAHHLGEHEVIG